MLNGKHKHGLIIYNEHEQENMGNVHLHLKLCSPKADYK